MMSSARAVARSAGFIAAIAGCASPGVPPGGPVDTGAPQIVRIVPDSGRTGTSPREVIFRFDEVVSEKPSGAPSLAALFMISPRDGEPRVEWHRDEISVRPRRGWRKNTAYTITLLPGVSDLRGNTRNTGAVTLFATGPTIPAGRISGTLYNWAEGRPVVKGLVEARLSSDTGVVYVTSSDSAGRFVLSTLGPGRYRVRGLADENNNKGLDPREPWDSSAVTLADSISLDMYAFVHDSLGARLSAVTVRDSVTLELSFDNPLSPAPILTAANVRVRASDSTDVPVVSVSPPAPDSSAKKLARPTPLRTVIVKLARPLRPRADYRVRVTEARNLMGVLKSSERPVSIPAPPVVPPAPPPPPPPSPRR
ncbi:MAG TPA: Ig-like domain-containing protein [Gemmatimonadaceae bacterium]|nr:Ig-like domain-containing protein [Gemmatimonadaceae bacterium]